MNLLLLSVGLNSSIHTLNIILPIGISFYTFHGISYVLDVFNNKINAEKNFIDYSLFVSFFPLLVAGPIERATHLLPQIKQARRFNVTLATEGLRQIIWGLFKKMVIADNCAPLVEMIFNADENYKGAILLLGAFLFTIQIYGDFSGYSDIALGSARLLGFELLQNFKFPYFSQDIADFWRRWHMSLSSWFKDYLYIPLGGSKNGKWKAVRNTFVVFLVSGFWHGANWTFIVWGLVHALLFIPLLTTSKNRVYFSNSTTHKLFPSLKEMRNIALTFFLVMNAWIFFRAVDLTHAICFFKYLYGYLLGPNSNHTFVLFCESNLNISLILLIAFMFVVEWINRRYDYGLGGVHLISNSAIRWTIYNILFLLIVIYGNFNKTEFIYFAF